MLKINNPNYDVHCYFMKLQMRIILFQFIKKELHIIFIIKSHLTIDLYLCPVTY